jgi:aminopeptidase N
VRPESYIEITNFYTATVYNKGAELIRMMQTILGPEAFRKGSDLYFERHDGEAVTCEDFVRAMEDASGVDLSQFRLWYSQAGTPLVKAHVEHDASNATAILHLAQSIPDTPGQTGKSPMVLPLKTALIGADSGVPQGEEQLVLLTEGSASVRFEGVVEPPLLSINREFSAPVLLDVQRRAGELERLAEVDPDPFARYEACQELMMRALLAGARGESADSTPVIAAMRGTLISNALDPAFKGEALSLPTEGLIGDRMELVDPDAIHSSRETLRSAIGAALANELGRAQSASISGADLSPQAKGIRRLKSVALSLLAAGDPARGAALAKAQFDAADNMTDRQGAMMVLGSMDGPEREAAFAAFFERYRDDSLVLDKWFALQAAAQHEDTVDVVEALAKHPDFTVRNPNRWRALVSNFAANQWAFHHASGRGYRFVTDMILEVDRINPQVAARQVPSIGRWRRFEPTRAKLMRAELERIVATPGLSKDVFEQASKSLA